MKIYEKILFVTAPLSPSLYFQAFLIQMNPKMFAIITTKELFIIFGRGTCDFLIIEVSFVTIQEYFQLNCKQRSQNRHSLLKNLNDECFLNCYLS